MATPSAGRAAAALDYEILRYRPEFRAQLVATRDELLGGEWRIGGLPVLHLSSWNIRPTFVD